MSETARQSGPRNAFCSFCRKGHQVAGPLVQGPDEVYICYACILLCKSIAEKESERRGIEPGSPKWYSSSD
ncbi:MAG: hypothetical protein HY040_20980 [Planctomycetes bacterium]|nr:hypothetical protein [Planctomycetota bacterium]